MPRARGAGRLLGRQGSGIGEGCAYREDDREPHGRMVFERRERCERARARRVFEALLAPRDGERAGRLRGGRSIGAPQRQAEPPARR